MNRLDVDAFAGLLYGLVIAIALWLIAFIVVAVAFL